MASIFISHASVDKHIASGLLDKLRSSGYDGHAFLDVHSDDGFVPGQDWEDTIYREVSRCSILLMLISEHWLKSKWCHTEYAFARAMGKSIVPYLIEGADRKALDASLKSYQLGDLQQAEDQLLRTIVFHWPKSASGFVFKDGQPPYVACAPLRPQIARCFLVATMKFKT